MSSKAAEGLCGGGSRAAARGAFREANGSLTDISQDIRTRSRGKCMIRMYLGRGAYERLAGGDRGGTGGTG